MLITVDVPDDKVKAFKKIVSALGFRIKKTPVLNGKSKMGVTDLPDELKRSLDQFLDYKAGKPVKIYSAEELFKELREVTELHHSKSENNEKK